MFKPCLNKVIIHSFNQPCAVGLDQLKGLYYVLLQERQVWAEVLQESNQFRRQLIDQVNA